MNTVLGELFQLVNEAVMNIQIVHTFGTPSFSITLRKRFISEIQVASLPPSLISSSLPFSHNLSFVKDGSAREVVVERRWS